MTGFTFTIEDLRSAPPQVRQWLVGRIEADLAALASPPPSPAPMPQPALAACTPEEAFGVLELLKSDVAATRVLFELARNPAQVDGGGALHAVNIGVLMRNAHLDEQQLVSCLNGINRAFQTIRRDPEATLFGFDQAEHLYVDDRTYRSIRAVWQELARPHAPQAGATQPPAWPGVRFSPPRLGPSEDIATHRQH